MDIVTVLYRIRDTTRSLKMLQKIKYLTTINNDKFLTSYFFHKASSTVLPVEIKNNNYSAGVTPNIYNTIQRIFSLLNINVAGIKLYLYRDGLYYTYITLHVNENEYDINSNFSDALKIGKLFDAPIYASDQILNYCGIKITKEMIEKNLVS